MLKKSLKHLIVLSFEPRVFIGIFPFIFKKVVF